MGFRPVAGLVACCDNCSTDYEDEDDRLVYFTTEKSAIEHLTKDRDEHAWQRMPDGRLVCNRCSSQADCALTGHQLVEWHESPSKPGTEVRYCTHCNGEFERRDGSEPFE